MLGGLAGRPEMNFQPLISASGAVQLHVACALAALVLGMLQLSRQKGDAAHRIGGYGWVLAMLVVAISSFWIHAMDQWYGFSWIHLLSVVTLIAVPLGVQAARRGNIRGHRIAMVTTFWSALVVAGVFTLLPGRILHRVLFE